MEVVDTETAKEFMKETLAAVDVDQLTAICADVEAKSALFRERLAPAALPDLGREPFSDLVTRIFSTRGKPRLAIAEVDITALRVWLAELLDGDGDPGARMQAFAARFPALPERTRIDFTTELLHFARPDGHWLWTRWMWDPKNRTGALPLVTTAAYRFDGADPGEVYHKVGQAVAFVHRVGEAAGFQKISRSVFGTDVYLACVYVIYAYTVLKMRMTQEFNKVMPGLPEFCRRLLGVHRGI